MYWLMFVIKTPKEKWMQSRKKNFITLYFVFFSALCGDAFPAKSSTSWINIIFLFCFYLFIFFVSSFLLIRFVIHFEFYLFHNIWWNRFYIYFVASLLFDSYIEPSNENIIFFIQWWIQNILSVPLVIYLHYI